MKREQSGGDEVVVVFKSDGKLAHGGVADHDVDEFFEAIEDVVLDVGDVMFDTNSFDERLSFLVREHGEVGEDVVLDLVI